MKAECFRNLNKGWDENCGPSDDDDMCIRLAKNFKIGCINEALGIYHTENDDRMMKNKKLIADGYFKLINKHAEGLINLPSKIILEIKKFIKFKILRLK